MQFETLLRAHLRIQQNETTILTTMMYLLRNVCVCSISQSLMMMMMNYKCITHNWFNGHTYSIHCMHHFILFTILMTTMSIKFSSVAVSSLLIIHDSAHAVCKFVIISICIIDMAEQISNWLICTVGVCLYCEHTLLTMIPLAKHCNIVWRICNYG